MKHILIYCFTCLKSDLLISSYHKLSLSSSTDFDQHMHMNRAYFLKTFFKEKRGMKTGKCGSRQANLLYAKDLYANIHARNNMFKGTFPKEDC